MDAPTVMRAEDGAIPAGPPTPGMERRQLVDQDDRWIGWARTTPGMASGWHHHGDRETYIFMARGSLTIEYGPGGQQQIACTQGDFAYLPPRAVHREVTGPDEPAEAFVVRIGSGPQNINVDGPDPVIA